MRVYRSGSLGTALTCTHGIHRFCSFVGKTPDELLAGCWQDPVEEIPNPGPVRAVVLQLEEYVQSLLSEERAGNTIHNRLKPVKALFRVHGIDLKLPYTVPGQVKFFDRAPTPEELQRLLDVADVRERVIVTWVALGGCREGTLAQLRYRHFKEDWKRGKVPACINVPNTIVKGHYASYFTFVGREGVDALKFYLDYRRQGIDKKPPEQITDDTPLIRDEHLVGEIRPIRPQQIFKIVHGLYLCAGLLNGGKEGIRYKLRPHSIRKFFKTWLSATGVGPSYVEFWMGHKEAYNDPQALGVEQHRNIYAVADLIRAMGEDPEKILTSEALTMPAATHITAEDGQYERLQETLRDPLTRATRASDTSAPPV